MKNVRSGSPAQLEAQLCFQLYAASRAVTAAYRRPLADLGLTYPQYLTMLALWEQDGRTVSELCSALDLDSGTLSPILKRLQRDGLIAKERSDDDERSVRVRCTPGGAELEQRAAPVREAVEASTGLRPEEFARLRETLRELRDAVRA